MLTKNCPLLSTFVHEKEIDVKCTQTQTIENIGNHNGSTQSYRLRKG